MVKKTLKQKINCVKWSALVFAIVYFLIGAWLKSDGPLFDSDKAYELIGDSLTLTAYFLAPIAAFVLFSDWREQHNKSFDANFFLKFYEGYFDYRFQINSNMTEINKLLNNEEPMERISGVLITFNVSTSKMIQLMSDISEIVGKEAYENDFRVLIEDLNGKFESIKKLMQDLINAGEKIKNKEQMQKQFQGLDADLYGHMKSFLFHARSHYRA